MVSMVKYNRVNLCNDRIDFCKVSMLVLLRDVLDLCPLVILRLRHTFLWFVPIVWKQLVQLLLSSIASQSSPANHLTAFFIPVASVTFSIVSPKPLLAAFFLRLVVGFVDFALGIG